MVLHRQHALVEKVPDTFLTKQFRQNELLLIWINMTTQLNREIHDILNSAKQSAYLEDLYNLFTDLEEDYEEEKRHSDQEKLSSLSKIFSIQFPLFIQKTHPILFMFKNKALLEVATQYVFNNSLEVQYDLISDFPDLKYLITSEEINSSFTPDAFEEKIGYDKIQDILIEIQSFNKSDFYDDNIDNVCVKYDINKKRFDDTFIYKEKNIYLNNNIAYHNEHYLT